MKKCVISSVLAFAMAFALLVETAPPVQAAGSREDAYQAYYDFLSDEIDNMGLPIRDLDYYRMFTDQIVRYFSLDAMILAAYLRDVTGDGVEDLIYKKMVVNTSDSPMDPERTEWICVYSYVDGTLKRIGQSHKYLKKDGDQYIRYEPEGYIGDIKSNYGGVVNECLYYCRGADGMPYLADADPRESVAHNISFSVYSFNGSVMQKKDQMDIDYVADKWLGMVPINPRFEYRISGETVSVADFESRVETYSSRGVEELVNNDYMDVYKTLAAVAATEEPSSWAAKAVNTAKSYGFLPKELQGKYTQPITRREFCQLAAHFYECTTGIEITELASFTDTQDLSVQKMGGLGVINGVGNNRFAPDSNLTRQEAATILARLSSVLGYTLPDGPVNYADNAAIADWAKVQVGQMATAGIMNGTGKNNFSPRLSYTREQAIATLMRLYDTLPWDDIQLN